MKSQTTNSKPKPKPNKHLPTITLKTKPRPLQKKPLTKPTNNPVSLTNTKDWVLETFPVVFNPHTPRPLDIGIAKRLIDCKPENISNTSIKKFLRQWTNQLPYLKSVAAPQSQRHALNGSPTNPITDQHRSHAQQLLQRKYNVRD